MSQSELLLAVSLACVEAHISLFAGLVTAPSPPISLEGRGALCYALEAHQEEPSETHVHLADNISRANMK